LGYPDEDGPPSNLPQPPTLSRNGSYTDPHGYAVPLGSHARRLNPRDTAHNMNRRRMIRRGATYGPALPDGAPEDGLDRVIAAFIFCASLIRPTRSLMNTFDIPVTNKMGTAPRGRRRHQ